MLEMAINNVEEGSLKDRVHIGVVSCQVLHFLDSIVTDLAQNLVCCSSLPYKSTKKKIFFLDPLKYPKSTLVVLRKCQKMKKRP